VYYPVVPHRHDLRGIAFAGGKIHDF